MCERATAPCQARVLILGVRRGPVVPLSSDPHLPAVFLIRVVPGGVVRPADEEHSFETLSCLPRAKPGLEPPFLRGLAFGLLVSAAFWALIAAILVLGF